MFTAKQKKPNNKKKNNNNNKNVNNSDKKQQLPQMTEKRLKKLESIEVSLTDFLFGNQTIVEVNKDQILNASAVQPSNKKRTRSESLHSSDSDSDSENEETKEEEENIEQLDDNDLFMIDKPSSSNEETEKEEASNNEKIPVKIFVPLKPVWNDAFTDQIYIHVDSASSANVDGGDDNDDEYDYEDLKENARASIMDHNKSIMQSYLSRNIITKDASDASAETGEDNENDENLITGTQYESRMRQLYQKIHKTPKWARLETERVTVEESEDRIVIQEKLKDSSASAVNDSTFANDSTDRAFDQSRHITKGQLDFNQCVDANEQERPSDVLSVRFHPHSDLLAALGSDRTVRLFQVADKQKSVLVDRFVASDDSDKAVNNKRRKKKRRDVSASYTNGGASVNGMEFTADGMEMIMTSPNTRLFFVCDMRTGESHIVSNLVHRIGGVNQGSKRGRTIQVEDSLLPMIRCSSNNELIAIASANNCIELLSRESKFSVGQLMMSDPVRGFDFSSDSLTLYAATKSGKVYLWDIRQQRPRHVFQDEGSIDTTCISIFDSTAKSRIACGSSNGVVNMYDLDHVQTARDPKPLKSLMNLTTSVTRAQFSRDGKLLCIASKDKANAVKMVHVESMSVYSHFPYQPSANTSHQMTVNDFHFNSGSQYLAMSTGTRVRLFQFPYYAQNSL